jgi:hypothetical protein
MTCQQLLRLVERRLLRAAIEKHHGNGPSRPANPDYIAQRYGRSWRCLVAAGVKAAVQWVRKHYGLESGSGRVRALLVLLPVRDFRARRMKTLAAQALERLTRETSQLETALEAISKPISSPHERAHYMTVNPVVTSSLNAYLSLGRCKHDLFALTDTWSRMTHHSYVSIPNQPCAELPVPPSDTG